MDGVKHAGRLQRLPSLLRLVPGAVEQDKMRVQLRVKGAGRRVHESRADQVAGDAILVLDATLANPSGGELFQFPERERGGFLVSLDDALVVHGDGQNRNRFGRSALEVEKNPPVFYGGLRQLLAGVRVQVVAQFKKSIARDHFARLQSQSLAADESIARPESAFGCSNRCATDARRNRSSQHPGSSVACR